ncbi:MAG: site-specific DNA-methyltransferase [Lachnospiraceae bacterium]|nr:site-specific DNA-methyltransferase [Lachnospiraceae bacterium]
MKEKATRNKTIDISLEDGKEYLERCIAVEHSVTVSDICNQVIVGDTMKVMEHLPHRFVNLLIVDPPYNLDKDYHGKKFNAKSREAYREYTITWLETVLPLLIENASIYVCCDLKSSLVSGEVLYNYFHVQNRITWQREKGRGAKSNWKNGMEDVWFATMGNEYTFNLDAVKIRKKVIAPYRVEGKPKDWEITENGNFRNTCPSNFWDDISIPYWSMPENTAHPTQKPEKLIAKLILASSNEGDVIFDPFAGSGTTAVTAKKLKRNFVVIEQNELYCVWAQKRLEMAEEDSSIQGYCGGVFWERNSLVAQKQCKETFGEENNL